MSSIYQEILLQHAGRPHNYGKLSAPTGKIALNNPLCGDEIEMEIEIKNKKVKNIAFSGKGCAISKASASLLTDFVKGKSIEELRRLDKTSIMQLLGVELGPNRIKCALLPLEALHKLLL